MIHFSVLKMSMVEDVPKAVPTLVEIKKILPKHCFQPSLLESFYYVLKDIVIIAILYVSYVVIEQSDHNKSIKYAIALLYWYLQGTMFWALFVLGHDCGHGSFSKYGWINDIMGNLLHG